MGPWRRELARRLRRGAGRSPARRRTRQGRAHPILLTLAVGLGLAVLVIGALEARLRPTVAQVARTQAQNQITALLEQAVMEDLAQRQVGYADFVTIQRDGAGAVTALTTDMAAMNRLRAQLISQVLLVLDGVDVSLIQVPLGSLVDSELVWARGPSIRARAMTVGTVSAEFESEFSSAGVNQTLHRIWLELSVPLTVLLPGSRVEVPVDTRLCVAETIIVGQVPDTYLQWGQSPTAP